MVHEPADPRELLRSHLSGRDAFCPSCGFNLRNSESDRCGECGTPIQLAVAGQRPRLGPWSLCIVGAAAPLGFAGIIAVCGWWRYWRDPVVQRRAWGHADWTNLLTATGVTIACLILIRLHVWRAGPFVRRRRGIQWLLSLVWLSIGIAFSIGLIYVFSAIYEGEYRYR